MENHTWDLAPRCWYNRLASALEGIGFRASACNESLFLMGEGESLVLLLVYVDDILLFSSSDKEIDGEEREVVTPLPSEFKLIKAAEGGGVDQKGVEVVKEKGEQLGEGKVFLSCFADATWASEHEDSSSVGGYICMLQSYDSEDCQLLLGQITPQCAKRHSSLVKLRNRVIQLSVES
ncbi:hypothetical protein CLOM_g16412 [Closterium sp. NIES-68]|nr:hypothetical protein CLOM_g16412 [Closterium sp. NIES-68]